VSAFDDVFLIDDAEAVRSVLPAPWYLRPGFARLEGDRRTVRDIVNLFAHRGGWISESEVLDALEYLRRSGYVDRDDRGWFRFESSAKTRLKSKKRCSVK
jgi:hypothetical protein